MNLSEHVKKVLAISPEHHAVSDARAVFTWGDLASRSNDLDALLDEAGQNEGAPVACLLRTRVEHVATVTALIASRRAIVTVNPAQGQARLHSDLTALAPAVVVADTGVWDQLENIELIRSLGAVAIEVGLGGVQRISERTRPAGGDHLTVPPDTAVQMLTSGTTGPPKRVPLGYRALEDALLGAAHYGTARGNELRLSSGTSIIASPLVHISGIWQVLTALVAGRSMALLERFAVDSWVELVRTHRPKAVSLVPTALRMVLAADVDRGDLESIQVVTCGTAPIEPDTADAFEEKYGIPVLVLYGATEFSGGVTGWTLSDHRRYKTEKRGSVGRAHPGIDLQIVDPTTGQVLPTASIGLLEVKGRQIGLERGWVRTTDLARLDADGFLWIEGRIDDAIIRGGFKIVPADVERVLQRHPAVQEASVVGLPDARLGAVPVAAVELKAGMTAAESELLAYARDHLAAYQVPVALRVVAALPRTPSLKVSRPDVRVLFEPAVGS